VNNRTLICIGGGELRSKETASIDAYIASMGKARAALEDRRGIALFFPTASHDSLPYFNTFRKTYTSDHDMKAEVALLTKKDIPLEKIQEKVNMADVIYVGGGNTNYMLSVWKQNGIDKMIWDAYNRGVILAGISAGAICWFEKMFSDSSLDETGSYQIFDGLALMPGLITPHYNHRKAEFESTLSSGETALAIEDKSAIVFENEQIIGSITSGGKSYKVTKQGENLIEQEINPL